MMYNVVMHIEEVPNRCARPTILLRQSYRDGKKVRKRTLANLTRLPAQHVQTLRRLLKGQKLVPANDAFLIERSWPHGHVKLILAAMRHIGLDNLIASRPSRERNLVLAMIADRLLHGRSKLATTRLWHTTTLAQELGVEDADADDLYEAMDWLLKRQSRIEKKLAARHLQQGGQVLYDVTSSYYEGRTCALAQYGHDRDGSKGRPIIVYGVLADAQGRPIAVEVYAGNTADPTTVPDQVQKLRQRFGLERVVLVGDRGMLTQTQIDALKAHPELGWISALRSTSIRKLVRDQALQMSLFDEQNLAEITSPEFPGERLMACYNPMLADERRRKRDALLAATEQKLESIARQVRRRTRTPMSGEEIGMKVGEVANRYKVRKHFELTIDDGRFEWARDENAIEQERLLDGIYVIRTSEPAHRLSAADTVRSYKNLSHVERGFRCLKGIDIRVRPIHHRDALRVRAHIFLCLLAYYVEWRLRQALGSLLFDDEELAEHRAGRDPVAPAEPSSSAQRKKATGRTCDGFPVHSFDTLLQDLGTLCRHRCRIPGDATGATFNQETQATPLQARVFELLELDCSQ